MDWINFDDIKKAGSLEMVLQHYGITLKRVNGISLRGKCPLPLHDSNEWQQFYGQPLKRCGRRVGVSIAILHRRT